MDERLKFRRQFLLTRAPVEPPPGWTLLPIGPFFLYAHPDLEVHQAEDAGKTLVLVGQIFDPRAPEKGNAAILGDLHAAAGGLDAFFEAAKPCTGNFLLIYKSASDFIIRHDALGLNQIFYAAADNRVVCGSQPNLLAAFADPEIRKTGDPDVLDFFENHLKDTRWIGETTLFEGVRQLIPNHYLDLRSRRPRRYWPRQAVPRLGLEEAVSRSCAYLQGSLKALAARRPLMMAVTAGTDSRTLLAASRDIRDRIYYFINDHGLGPRHPDIAVPAAMFRTIGVPFHVEDVPAEVDEDFRRTYHDNTFFTTERLLTSIYNVYFKRHGDKANVTGTGEIGRLRFGKEPRRPDAYLLAYKLSYPEGPRYVIKECERMLAEMRPAARRCGVNLLTLLYWEQLSGIWGNVTVAESQIAVDVFDPYDSHLLYEIFLGIDDKYTAYTREPGAFFRAMIRRMWPELLKWPINPPETARGRASRVLAEIGLLDRLKTIRYHVQRARFRRRTGRRSGG